MATDSRTDSLNNTLWAYICEQFRGQGFQFGETLPQINLIVPGNKADTLSYCLVARIIDQIAWVAMKDGKPASYLQLHEHAAYILPQIIQKAKELKHH